MAVDMRLERGLVSAVFYEEERTPAMQPVSNVVKKAVQRARSPRSEISFARCGTNAEIPPTKMPMLATCTNPQRA